MRCTAAVLAVALLGCLRAAAEDEQVTFTVTKDLKVADFLDGATQTVGRPILYDPASQRIGGNTMGVDMRWSVPKGRELDLVRSILAFYELTLVPVGPRGHEILLAIDTRSTNSLVKAKAEFVPRERLEEYADKDGVYIMTTIPVAHVENLTLLRTALSTMVTPAGIGRVHEVPGAQAVLIMDYGPAVVAMARTIKELDIADPVVTATIRLGYAEANALATTLRELFVDEPRPQQGQQAPFAGRGPRIAAYAPANAIVVVGREGDLARIREVVKQLDVKPE